MNSFSHSGNSNIKGIIFDMDGTIINSTYCDYLAWKKLLEEFGIHLEYDEYIGILGIKGAEVLKSKIPSLSEEEIHNLLKKKLVLFKEIATETGINAIPFVKEFILDLKKEGLPIGLASSSRREKINFVLSPTGLLEMFDVIVSGEDVKNGKPHPDIFLTATNSLNLLPEEVIIFEDAAIGVKAARNANIRCVAITTTTPPEQLTDADFVINSYKDISLDFLRKFF